MTVLANALWPARRVPEIRTIALALAGSLLLAASARIQIPLQPVPMTMQTFAVLVLGAAFGARLGAATVMLYVMEGLMGLPVFADGAGPAYVMGPTGGYLVGFIVAAGLVGYLAERGWNGKFLLALIAMALGHITLFAFGVAWLAELTDSFGKAFLLGAAPFVWVTALKTLLAAATVRATDRLIRR